MTLAEKFEQAAGRPIVVDGRTVHAIYTRNAQPGLTMRLRWRHRIDMPVQGVSVSVEGGVVQVGDVQAKDMVLWTDTAPDEVTLRFEGKALKLFLWNCWRIGGVTQAWVGNYGMIVDELEGGVLRFRCKSNSGPQIMFDDLVFEVVFEPMP